MPKYRQLQDGDTFQFVDSHHSMAEYEKVDAAHYRLVGIGPLEKIADCPKGNDEFVVSQQQGRRHIREYR
jgi:hypothetical protein